MGNAEQNEAHRHSSRHREEVMASEVCGCFYCLSVFPPGEIERWIGPEGGDTAICPKCGIDSVIGSASGLPITEEFLTRMKRHWFAPARRR